METKTFVATAYYENDEVDVVYAGGNYEEALKKLDEEHKKSSFIGGYLGIWENDEKVNGYTVEFQNKKEII
ncbi:MULTISPECIES: hypothetical protein [Bacillus]|uniref:hypothetical protein n=1 Tax=Bacillus TaxID=1386 RepID=UPI0003680F04|nr:MULTISPECIES: hypothetical protein [Bacillus]MED1539111.1 hypothetical protein [Bacillus pseudomycoides]PGC41442.1 hypothetical protein COM18_11050 [Bacillus pseudomycoides]